MTATLQQPQRRADGRFLPRVSINRPSGPPPSAERQRLASAIARHREAREHLQRLRDAERRSMDLRIDCAQEVDKAEALLEEARADAPHAYVAALLDGGPHTTLVEEAEIKLEKAQAALRRHREGEAALRAAVEEAERRFSTVEMNVSGAVAEVVKTSPEVLALLEAYRRAQLHLAGLDAALRAVGVMCVPDPNWDCRAPNIADVSRALADEWAAALAALADDAHASLPSAAV